ncbi:MAG: hypothetical protein ABEJ65_05540 [bacterium]
MTPENFKQFMSEQVEEIREFRSQLEEERGEEVTIDEAARVWIQRYADQFRDKYQQSKQAS